MSGGRVVEPEGHASFFAGIRQLLHNVLAIRSAGDLVLRVRSVEHTEAVMIFVVNTMYCCRQRGPDQRRRAGRTLMD